MANIEIAAIQRSGAYSPNHIGNDAAIILMVADRLRKHGYTVTNYSEEQLCRGEVSQPVIINMCRELRSIKELQKLEDEGRLIINSGYAIENCICERMGRILQASAVNYPESLFVSTDEAVKEALSRRGFTRMWIKRGDSHGLHKEDVSYVRHAAEAQDVLQEYFLRGIRTAVINRHLDGNLVKFYGLRDNSFFLWYYPMEEDTAIHIIATRSRSTDTDPQLTLKLRSLAHRAAEALDVDIYGGEIMLGADGEPTVIDFNDWPSFSSCRAEAAPRIARYIQRLIKERFKP